MNTSAEKRGKKTVLRIHHDIVDMKSGEAFKAALTELYNQGEKEIVLDFRGIQCINSHGIGKILMFYKRFHEIGGKLYVAPLHGSMKEIFETLMLDKLISQYNV
jgi:anti-sigma B factor antagonist